MPSKSLKQHQFMCIQAKQGKGRLRQVGKEFCRADKGRKFKK